MCNPLHKCGANASKSAAQIIRVPIYILAFQVFSAHIGRFLLVWQTILVDIALACLLHVTIRDKATLFNEG
jgi:hypothetical protein